MCKYRKIIVVICLVLLAGALALLILFQRSATDNAASGIAVAIRSYTPDNFLLKLKFYDENGLELLKLTIPVKSKKNLRHKYNKGTPSFDYYREFAVRHKHKSFALEAELQSAPSGARLSRRIVFWPGKAGLASGGKPIVIVEISIKNVDGKTRLSFEGIL